MAKKIIKAIVKAKQNNFMSYELQISDGSTIVAWARPYLNVTSIVRTSKNFKEIDEYVDDSNVYMHRDRYYRYTPGCFIP